MITWITTVGWSPFAVINPIWAYCKENDEIPSKIVIIFTSIERIKNNLEVCKHYISGILRNYSNQRLGMDNIIIEAIQNDDLQVYADKFNQIIEREVELKPSKIILDMTPGRKYMSAINVYLGQKIKDLPVEIYYLHLEEPKFHDIPYPLTPIVKNELINILESTEIFSHDLGQIKLTQSVEKNTNDLPSFTNELEQKRFLILLAIEKGLKSKRKIRQFIYSNNIHMSGSDCTRLLKELYKKKLINKTIQQNKVYNQEYDVYSLTPQGKTQLSNPKRKIQNKQEGGTE